MRARIVLAALSAIVAVGAGVWLVRTSMDPTGSGASSPPSGSAAAGGAGSSAGPTQTLTRTSTASTPTPAPFGGGPSGVPATLEIYVSIDIVAQEPTEDSDGMVDVPMFAAASGPFPGPLDAPVTAIGTATIGPHPAGAAGCTWARTYASEDFIMTVLPPAAGSNGVSLVLDAPAWHYTVSCPNAGVVTRLPAFGELQMLAYLGFAFPEHGPPAPQPIDVPPVSVAPDCIRRETQIQRSVQLADVTLRIVIYEPPCLLPV